MGYNMAMARSMMKHVKDLPSESKGSVCELGNQTVRGDVETTYGVKTAKDFYELIGYNEYVAIDVNEKLDAVAMDLNYDIKERYGYTKQYDLVTNNGTGEHLFNQHAVFKNMHDLTKPGGYMFHLLPFHGSCDHGFFNFHPNLFAALAYQNDYEIVASFIVNSPCQYWFDVELTLQRQTGLLKNTVMKTKYHDNGWDPNIAVLYRKKLDNEFTIPMQYLYSGDNIATEEISQNYKKVIRLF